MSGSYLEDLGLNTISPILASNVGSVGNEPDEFDLDLSLFTNSIFFEADYNPVDIRGGEIAGAKMGGPSGSQISGLETRFPGFGDFEPFRAFSPLPEFVPGNSLLSGPSTTAAPDILPTTAVQPPASKSNTPASHNPPSVSIPRARKHKTSPKDLLHVTAEEDKRRRNTAASARFRVKKKQREQQLQETVKKSMENAERLEERVKELEMENRWLKNLVVEKKESEEFQDAEPEI